MICVLLCEHWTYKVFREHFKFGALFSTCFIHKPILFMNIGKFASSVESLVLVIYVLLHEHWIYMTNVLWALKFQ
jgi:hypothetical protein